MKIAKRGVDWKVIDENNIDEKEREKVHLIKLMFDEPTEKKVNTVMESFPSTQRYIVEATDIKQYNDLLKNRKKYYVENTSQSDLITFMKKNNKVILNIEILKDFEYDFICKNPWDVLRNIECIMMSNNSLDDWHETLERWSGNVLLLNL